MSMLSRSLQRFSTARSDGAGRARVGRVGAGPANTVAARQRAPQYSRGFTLIEMMVSISIIVLISSTIIFQYTKFDSQLLLRDLAYEIALSLREAQVLGVSVRGASSDFDKPYGVHFDTTSNKTYIVFRDTNGNYKYDSGEAITTYTIARGAYISAIYAPQGTSRTSLDITFKRPDPDAHIRDNAYSVITDERASAEIRVVSPRDATNVRKIVVFSTGQISVQ